MLQVIVLAVSVAMVGSAFLSFAGKLKLTKDKTLSGGASIVVGIGLLAGSAGAAYFALMIMPRL